MRAILQRVTTPANVIVNNEITGQINKGIVILLGIENEDSSDDLEWLARKICNMRIFNDQEGKMNLSINDINGGLLVISQFTLFASTKKGNRPSFLRSAKPSFAESMYEAFVTHIRNEYKLDVGTGVFGADMKVNFTNDGPVTIILDSKNKE